MGKLHIPPPEQLLPPEVEGPSEYDGLAEAVEHDTMRPGVYAEIVQGRLVPVARQRGGCYTDHNLVTPEEAQKLYDEDPFIEVLSVFQWYQSLEL
jgi:hypothetical protein